MSLRGLLHIAALNSCGRVYLPVVCVSVDSKAAFGRQSERVIGNQDPVIITELGIVAGNSKLVWYLSGTLAMSHLQLSSAQEKVRKATRTRRISLVFRFTRPNTRLTRARRRIIASESHVAFDSV